MEKACLVLNNGEPFLVYSYEKLTKNKDRLYGQFNDGKPGYVVVSFPVWTLPKKRCTLERLLETHYIIWEVHKENA